jgi:hypothetical protein
MQNATQMITAPCTGDSEKFHYRNGKERPQSLHKQFILTCTKLILTCTKELSYVAELIQNQKEMPVSFDNPILKVKWGSYMLG